MIYRLSSESQLINYLKFHIEQLTNIIESTQSTPVSNNPPDRFSLIKARLNAKNLTINEIFSIEQELIQLYPDRLLPSLYMETKDRYIKALPNESQDKIKILDEDTSIKNEAEEQRNRLRTLYNHLQKYYFFINDREYFVHEMKTNFIIMLFFLAFITLLSSYYCLNYQGDLQLSLLVGMACAGYLGAIISTVNRIQSMAEAPIDGADREAILLKIYQGKRGIYLSILLGTFAPFIIYLLLRFIPADKGIVIFGISFLPVFKEPVILTQPNIGDLYLTPNLRDAKDIAKILFISMLSGFSERLVPDVLDRISNELNNQFKNHDNKQASQ
ncbi:hypothetical protein B2M27_24700 [Kluyvera intermedia]|uniref:Uncharacterized protein n=1 Tax=Kluyvera intermedia TaxID=61648 RepID=A0ABX3U824_KLUIN|nr:hypothetical protein [Kluyvera intermedia]ORJ47675.1 hypothetical protein B2M27_24700 [Kluyvera intermedia]